MSQFPQSDFWDFSLKVYGSESVPAACLALQDRHQADVNVLLYCCWLGCLEAAPAAPDRIEILRTAVDEWHETVVRQLRAVRKRLKEPVAGEDRELALSLRQRIQKIEIDAEHIEQLMLEGAVRAVQSPRVTTEALEASAVDNMREYLAQSGATLYASDAKDLQTIAHAARQHAPSTSAAR